MSRVIPSRAELGWFVVLLQQYRNACARNSRADEPDRPYFGPDRTSSAAIVWRDVWQTLDTTDFRAPLGWPSVVLEVFENLRFCPINDYQGQKFTSVLDQLDCHIKTLETVLREYDLKKNEASFRAPPNTPASESPSLTPGRQLILEVLAASARRMTKPQVLEALKKHEPNTSEATLRIELAKSAPMRKAMWIDHINEGKNRGYGITQIGRDALENSPGPL